MWGSCCFNVGDIKITLGTGSFLNLNTGEQCHASIYGLYPLVAWRYKEKQTEKSELVYCMEGAANDTGSIIQWAINFGKHFQNNSLLCNQSINWKFLFTKDYSKIQPNRLILLTQSMTLKKFILYLRLVD